MDTTFERFTISQSGVIIRDDKTLILEKAKRSGIWLLPGGRIDVNETWEVAFRREMREELGIDDFKVIGIADFDTWYTKAGVAAAAIVRLIHTDQTDIKLSDEHSQYQWITYEEITEYNFLWPNADRMLRKAFELHLNLDNA